MGDRGDQDPFEDLDQFFAPLEDEDWPEGTEGAEGESPPPAGYPAEGGGEPADALAGLDDLEIDLPEEGELLAEPAAGPSPEPPPPPPPAGEPEPAEAEAGAPAGDAPPGQEWDLETSDMAGEEWDRLRAEALAAGTEEGEGPPPGQEQPISAEDLAGAPPQYSDLPGPTEAPDEPSGPVLEDPVSGTGVEDEGVFGTEDAGVSVVGSPESEDEVPEAEPAEVEAAADRFATGMRPDEVERELLSDLGEEPRPETVRIEPAAPVATEEPEWDRGVPPAEEPAAAGAPTAGGRNLTAAMVSGGILGAAVLALLAIGKGPFLVLVVAAILLAQAELYAVMRSRGFQPATLLGLVCGGITVIGAYLQGEGALLLGPALAMGLSVPWYMAVAQPARKNLVANTAATVMGLMYVSFLGSFSVLILRPDGDIGRNMFLVVIATTVIYDVCAYAVGTIWGNRPLAPTISPHKSWEGAIGATVVVTLVIPLITSNVDPFDFGRALGLGLLISILAPLGDLVESAIKRDFGVKDMGSLLPGHGGMLDRIDAILFVVPGAYFLLRIVLGG